MHRSKDSLDAVRTRSLDEVGISSIAIALSVPAIKEDSISKEESRG